MDAGYLLSITYSHDVCSSFWTIVASLEPPKNGYWLNKCQLGSLPHVFWCFCSPSSGFYYRSTHFWKTGLCFIEIWLCFIGCSRLSASMSSWNLLRVRSTTALVVVDEVVVAVPAREGALVARVTGELSRHQPSKTPGNSLPWVVNEMFVVLLPAAHGRVSHQSIVQDRIWTINCDIDAQFCFVNLENTF